jgi:hypothetical protein
MMKRPYRYKLTFYWGDDCIIGGHEGYRTREDGTRENFRNNVFDGKDPHFAARLERTLYLVMSQYADGRPNSRSIKRMAVTITGDQAKE